MGAALRAIAKAAVGIKMVVLWEEAVDAARGRHGAVGGTGHGGGGAVKDAYEGRASAWGMVLRLARARRRQR
jgi:hypothetical protein